MDLNMKKSPGLNSGSQISRVIVKDARNVALGWTAPTVSNSTVTQKKKKIREVLLAEIPFLLLNTTKWLILLCHHSDIFFKVKMK